MPRYASSQRSYPKFQVTYFDKAITGKFSSEYCIRDPYAKGLIRPRPFIPASWISRTIHIQRLFQELNFSAGRLKFYSRVGVRFEVTF